MSDLEGVMLSDYLLLQCISKGGAADVYRACQNGEGNHEVAVKIFRSNTVQSKAFRDHFMTEAEKIGQFDHPHILPLLEFGEGEGLLYVVTPFVASGTLEDLSRRVGGKFSAMQALPIMQQLCSAVQYAHEHDVIHGNIKPTNIFVAADGSMLLADFGVAHGYDDSQQSLTRVGWGAAEYVAPEQSLGVLRRGSDIYSLGALLFRILTGQPPFTGQTPVEVLLKHVRQQPPAARLIVPNISDAVNDVLLKAMQKRSDDRFASAEEFSNAFFAGVTAAPVASPMAKQLSVALPETTAEQPSPAGNPPTPVSTRSSAGAEHIYWTPSPQTPVPATLALSPLPPHVTKAPGLDTREEHQPEHSPAGENAEMSLHLPLPDSNVDAKFAAPSPPASLEKAESDSKVEQTFSSRLNKLLPVVVVILLLLGLLGALLSSFFFPGDGARTNIMPFHGALSSVCIGVRNAMHCVPTN